MLLVEHWKAAHTGGPAQSNSGNTQLAGGGDDAIGKIVEGDASVGLIVKSQSNTTLEEEEQATGMLVLQACEICGRQQARGSVE